MIYVINTLGFGDMSSESIHKVSPLTKFTFLGWEMLTKQTNKSTPHLDKSKIYYHVSCLKNVYINMHLIFTIVWVAFLTRHLIIHFHIFSISIEFSELHPYLSHKNIMTWHWNCYFTKKLYIKQIFVIVEHQYSPKFFISLPHKNCTFYMTEKKGRHWHINIYMFCDFVPVEMCAKHTWFIQLKWPSWRHTRQGRPTAQVWFGQ